MRDHSKKCLDPIKQQICRRSLDRPLTVTSNTAHRTLSNASCNRPFCFHRHLSSSKQFKLKNLKERRIDVHWDWQRRSAILGETSLPLPLCLSQITHLLSWDCSRSPAKFTWKRICYIKSEIPWVISRPSEWRGPMQLFRINCSNLKPALFCRFVVENLKCIDLNTNWQ